jgi:hypothetical protein
MTPLGKVLVLVVVGASLSFCSYAVAIFANRIDWKAEVQRRDEILSQLGLAKQRAMMEWTYARDDLRGVEANIAGNQYWYDDTVDKIRSGKNFDIKDLKRLPNGEYDTDPKTGLPRFDKVISDKTYDGFLQVLNSLREEIKATNEKIDAKITAEKDLTEQLNGKYDPMTKKQLEKGLYDLIAHETDVGQRAREELEELKPKYFQELVDSQLLIKRRASLQARIKQLENMSEGTKQP